jgi:hypothetical protein
MVQHPSPNVGFAVISEIVTISQEDGFHQQLHLDI